MSAAEPDDPELPRTHSPRGPRGAPASAPFTPAARWVAEHQIKVLCMVVATASPILSLWMLARGTANLRQGIWAYSVDGAGTIHYGPVGPAQACFTRNPSGLSYPEVAGRIFVGDSWRTLEGDVRSELPERKRRNLYDHPEVEGIEVLDDGSPPRYRVRGFIVRSGAVEGLPYQPPAGEFHLIVELAPQEEAMQQGRYPFVVVRHRAVVRWPKGQDAP